MGIPDKERRFSRGDPQMKADERETGRTSIYIYIEFAEYVVQWTHRRFNVGT